jgi:type I restriction enzyme S subunit
MRTIKDSGIEWIGQIPQEWDVRKIKHCFNVYAGATPKSGNSEFWDGDIVWVTPADYTTEQKYVSEGRKSITSEGFESCSTEMIPAGSLIFSKRAPIGLVAINAVDLCTNQGCLSCVPLDENDVEYFYYAFSCFTEQFDLYGSGTTFKEISADAFMNFPIPYPSPDVQKKISCYLSSRCAEIDKQISANDVSIQKLKEYRQSVIYEAVTGKIEV